MKNKPTLLNLINYKLFTLSNKQYLKHIEKIKNSNSFLKLSKEEKIKIKYLLPCSRQLHCNSIFKINIYGKIEFLNFNNLILFEFEKDTLTSQIRSILNINIKNRQTYEVIITITKLQKEFLKSNDLIDLKYLSHKMILDYHQTIFNTPLISSNISTIINNTYYKDRKNITFKLKYLLPKKHFIIYLKCRFLLQENYLLSDADLAKKLFKEYNIKASKVSVYQIRKKYLIPNKKLRKYYLYQAYKKNFTQIYTLDTKNISLFEEIQGVYELLDDKQTVYIGSSKNIKQRLYTYLSGFGHTKEIRELISTEKVYFRVIKSDYHYELEKEILNAYFSSYKDYPTFNKNRIIKS